MSVAKDDSLPPTTAAVAQNPAQQAKLAQEAAVEESEATELVEKSDNAHSSKKKPDAGLGNYFVSLAIST